VKEEINEGQNHIAVSYNKNKNTLLHLILVLALAHVNDILGHSFSRNKKGKQISVQC